ncbi:iron complex outermembrane receptor protein [Ereboglobus sp. PH5-10]|uniref:TonB-dependent receptor n=1 Tax=Ereboglobus sp. PH5-10 TaxID=2940629 RepID=UPI00240637EB|nr:TonB-dependent receptor [Ereboglobus sp. PH5-10]MDF9827037.1 iron complex outermembrane receptor protein [Ereboglobus sp. PH5-10]
MNRKPTNPRSLASSASLLKKIATVASQPGVFTRALLAVLTSLFVLSAAPQLAAQTASIDPGSINGRVYSEATGNALIGALVYLDGSTTAAATTASGGVFTLNRVEPGEHTVRITYGDLDEQKKTVVVEAGTAADVEFTLASSLYILDRYVVSSAREGQASAITQQRQSDVMKNVVSADAFGNMLDTNAGEILKNIPGIFVNYDGEDVTSFSVRGISPNATTFTTDGNIFANSGLSAQDDYDRQVSLKTFSVAAVETIEVYKVPPPSSPANANGGVVNMVTKNAFDQKGRRISFGLNLNLNTKALDFGSSSAGGSEPSRKWGPGFNFYYSEAFLDNTLGVTLTLNAYENYRYKMTLGDFNETYRSLAADELPTADMDGYLNNYIFTEETVRNQNRTLSLNLDYKISRNTSVFLKTSYNDWKEVERNYRRLRYGHIGGTTINAANSDFDNIDTSGYWSMYVNSTTPSPRRYNQTWSVNPGVKHTFSWGRLDYDVFTSRAFTRGNSGITGVEMQSPYGHFLLTDARDEDGATITQQDVTDNNDWLNLDNWTAMRVNYREELMIDKRKGGKFNTEVPVVLLGHPLVLRAGGAYNDWSRNTYSRGSYYSLNSSSATPSYSEFYDENYGSSSGAANSVIPNWVSPHKVVEYFHDNPNMFTHYMTDYYANLARYTRDISEAVSAGYFMGSWQISNFNIMAGVRYEHTKIEASGWSRGVDWSTNPPTLDPNPETRDRLSHGENSYDNWFPNVQLKYEPLKDLVLRAGYTTTIQRPDMTKLVPSDSLEFNSTDQYYTYTVSNIELKPQYSHNYDISAEYYLPNAGVITAGWFYKEIKDYILERYGWADTMMPNIATWFPEPVWVRTSQNIGTAKMTGYEFSYNQRFKQFKFLPSVLQNLTFYGSFSYAKPKGDIEINNMKRKVLNTRLTYSARSWYATVAYYWCDSYLRRYSSRSLGSVEAGDFRMGDDHLYTAASDRWDISFNWQFSKVWTLSFDWRNVFNEKEEWTRYDRTANYTSGGTTIAVAIKANFR